MLGFSRWTRVLVGLRLRRASLRSCIHNLITMPKTSTPQATNEGDASRKFIKAVRQILSVPKEELARREADYQRERAVKKASRKSKLSALLIFFFWCLSIHSAVADPEERAQMIKARMLKRLVMDGWQLKQESHSLLVFEKPMTGWGGPVVQALTTGANGTHPMYQLSVTVTPDSDHYTHILCYETLNSQNAFGQTTSIPIKNKKEDKYINGVEEWAWNGLPEKYKHAK